MVVDKLAIVWWLIIQMDNTLMKFLITLIRIESSLTILETYRLSKSLSILCPKTLGLVMRRLSIHNFFRPQTYMIVWITFVLD